MHINEASRLLRWALVWALHCVATDGLDLRVPYYQVQVKPSAPAKDKRKWILLLSTKFYYFAFVTYNDGFLGEFCTNHLQGSYIQAHKQPNASQRQVRQSAHENSFCLPKTSQLINYFYYYLIYYYFFSFIVLSIYYYYF